MAYVMIRWGNINFLQMISGVIAAYTNRSEDTGAHMICLLSDIVVKCQKCGGHVISVNDFTVLYDLYLTI